MTKKVLYAALFVVLAFALVWAGDPTKKGMAGNAQMEMMKAEMMKCTVCSKMAPKMDAIGPMKMEAVKLDNGMAVIHTVVNSKNVATFHATCDEMSKAGEACMTMTDEQAKTDLCEFCQGMRSAMKAGAQMSKGHTKKGGMMVLTSSDPAVQAQLSTLHEKCAMMAASMDMPMTKTSAEKKY